MIVYIEDFLYLLFRIHRRVSRLINKSIIVISNPGSLPVLKTDEKTRRKIPGLFARKNYADTLDSLNKIKYIEAVDERYFANCYYRLGEKDKALEHIKNKLYIYCQKKPDFFVDMVDEALSDELGLKFRSEYTFLGGNENCGAILHYEERAVRYITMISKYDINAYTKEYYEWLISSNPVLDGLILPVILFKRYKNISMTTFPFVHGNSDTYDLDDVVSVARIIESCPIKGSGAHYIHFGVNTNIQRLFLRHLNFRFIVNRFMKELYDASLEKYSERCAEVALELQKIFNEKKLNKYIDKSFYSVTHGGYTLNNIIIHHDLGTDKPLVIDNSHYSISLKGYDIALFLSTQDISFDEIKEKVLNRYSGDFSGDCFHIWEFFFMLMLCHRKITRRKFSDVDSLYDKLLSPMLDYFKEIFDVE